MICHKHIHYYTLIEAANLAQMSYDGMRAAIKAGRIKGYRMRGIVLIRVDDLNEFIEPKLISNVAEQH
jgi:excisionase family DNA binding protein